MKDGRDATPVTKPLLKDLFISAVCSQNRLVVLNDSGVH